jgi:hypothetical protein
MVTLVESGGDMDVMELMELYRELGEFNMAELLASSIPAGYEAEAALQKKLLAELNQAPALIKW